MATVGDKPLPRACRISDRQFPRALIFSRTSRRSSSGGTAETMARERSDLGFAKIFPPRPSCRSTSTASSRAQQLHDRVFLDPGVLACWSHFLQHDSFRIRSRANDAPRGRDCLLRRLEML